MKLTVEMNNEGLIAIETDDEDGRIDVAAALLLFELARVKLLSQLMAAIAEGEELGEAQA